MKTNEFKKLMKNLTNPDRETEEIWHDALKALKAENYLRAYDMAETLEWMLCDQQHATRSIKKNWKNADSRGYYDLLDYVFQTFTEKVFKNLERHFTKKQFDEFGESCYNLGYNPIFRKPEDLKGFWEIFYDYYTIDARGKKQKNYANPANVKNLRFWANKNSVKKAKDEFHFFAMLADIVQHPLVIVMKKLAFLEKELFGTNELCLEFTKGLQKTLQKCLKEKFPFKN